MKDWYLSGIIIIYYNAESLSGKFAGTVPEEKCKGSVKQL
jgi:hypothetical protein